MVLSFVFCQFARLFEAGIANFTDVRSLASVGPHVDFDVGSVCEPSPTHGTLGWLLSLVGPLVGLQTGRRFEGPAAFLAGVVPLLGVRVHVADQMTGGGEGEATHRADEWPLARVCPQVHLQVARLHKCRPARLADKGPLLGVRAHVRLQPTVEREASATYCAQKRPFARVAQHVVLPMLLHFKGGVAKAALVRPLY